MGSHYITVRFDFLYDDYGLLLANVVYKMIAYDKGIPRKPMRLQLRKRRVIKPKYRIKL